MTKFIIQVLFFSLISSTIIAQDLQNPATFLGYELGNRFTYHHRVVDYFNHVAETSNKVKIQEYGLSYQGRPLSAAFISSPKNIANLEQIRENNLINIGLKKGSIKGKLLPIVWLSYNVHGDEAASTEAAIETLYQLVSKNDKKTKDWLDGLVIVIDPCLNPDGRDRYVNWFNEVASAKPNSSSDAIEHHQPYPKGRFNHYLFDLNRDWAWQTQIESQHRVKFYQSWMPQVHVDFHEMGINSPYFFAPAAEPYHSEITDWQRDFQHLVGQNHAKYFSEHNWLFYTKEIFDLLYPSYGDTWPIFNGAMGFTYEQGGSGQAGLIIQKEDGTFLTLKSRVEHHVTTSISSVEVSYRNRKKLVQEFKNYFYDAATKPTGTYKTFVISNKNHSSKIKSLLILLDKLQITYGTAPQNTKTVKGYNYATNKEENFQLNHADLIIRAHQAQSHMLNVMFEPQTTLSDSITYDLTAWALPYVFGLQAYAVKEDIPYGGQKFVYPTINNPMPQGTPYAYLAEWNDANDVAFLAALLTNDIKVRFTQEPLETEGKLFGRGSLIITSSDNRNLTTKLNDLVIGLANNFGIVVTPTYSGMTTKGRDFGSSKVRLINTPKVAIFRGKSVNAMAFGEVWHFFEQKLKYPVTTIGLDYASSVDINAYDVIVLPAGSYNGLRDKFLSFARKGGKVIVMDKSIRLFANDRQTALGKAEKTESQKKRSTNSPLRRYEDRERTKLKNTIAGSIYKVNLDDSHPLAFGYGSEMYLLKRNKNILPYLTANNSWNIGVFEEDCHMSGFVGSDLKARIPNSLALGVESYGKGKIIYMSDSPIFRGFWHTGELLMGNAVFFVGE